MHSFFTQMTKKLKCHFTKHFRSKFVRLAKQQFAGNFLPFAFRQSLMNLTLDSGFNLNYYLFCHSMSEKKALKY